MNTQPIETAKDADLRAVPQALARAALRARELAASTGTRLVVVQRGEVKRVAAPSESTIAPQLR
jgi:uncharacterized protein with PhoU and TrkA domain